MNNHTFQERQHFPARIRSLIIGLLLLAASFANAMPRAVFLVRHAERTSEAADSPISEAGFRRARLLAEILSQSGVSAIYATEYIRTQQTAKPLSTLLNVPVTVMNAAAPDKLVETLSQSTDAVALVVGHSRTLPPLIKALAGIEIPEISATDYDHLYLIVFGALPKPMLITLRFGGMDGAVPARFESRQPAGSCHMAAGLPRAFRPRTPLRRSSRYQSEPDLGFSIELTLPSRTSS